MHDSVAWDEVYDKVTAKFEVQFVAMDAGYKTLGLQRKHWMTERFPFFHTQEVMERKMDIVPGITSTTQ